MSQFMGLTIDVDTLNPSSSHRWDHSQALSNGTQVNSWEFISAPFFSPRWNRSSFISVSLYANRTQKIIQFSLPSPFSVYRCVLFALHFQYLPNIRRGRSFTEENCHKNQWIVFIVCIKRWLKNKSSRRSATRLECASLWGCGCAINTIQLFHAK